MLPPGADKIDEQNIVGPQAPCIRRRPQHFPGELSVSLDSHDASAGAAPQVQFRQSFAHKRGPIGDAQPIFAVREFVFLDPLAETRTIGGFCFLGCRQPAPRKAHIDDTKNEDRQAERREAEKAKALHAMTLELAVDDEIRRGRDKRRHPADQRSHAERHHQPAGSGPRTLRDAQHHRNEDGGDRRRTHRRAQSADDHHEKDDKPDFVASGLDNQPVAEPLCDARSYQPVADHEQCGDQNDVGVAEAGQRFTHGECACEGQHREHDQRNGVQTGLVDREHHDRSTKQDKDNDELRHCRFTLFGSCARQPSCHGCRRGFIPDSVACAKRRRLKSTVDRFTPARCDGAYVRCGLSRHLFPPGSGIVLAGKVPSGDSHLFHAGVPLGSDLSHLASTRTNPFPAVETKTSPRVVL